jgi:dihydrofolate reductase
MPKISMIVTHCSDRAGRHVISSFGKRPFNIKENEAYFRMATMGSTLVMGRNTWEAIPEEFRPQGGRHNIVVTSTPTRNCSVLCAESPEEALERAYKIQRHNIFVVGGQRVYEALLSRTEELHVTEVRAEIEGDRFFPKYRERFVKRVNLGNYVDGTLHYTRYIYSRPM